VNCKQSRKLQECIEDTFLVKAKGSPTRRETLLDLLLINMEKLLGKVMTGCSHHAVIMP